MINNNDPQYQAGLIMGLIFVFIFAFFTILTKPVYGQNFEILKEPMKTEESEFVYQQNLIDYYENEIELQKEELTNVILRMMTVWVNPNTQNPVYSSSCRNSRFGCENTIRAYASYFVDIANQFENIDPFLLAATAKHESNYNAFAKGSRGERGIMQILPASPIGEGVLFVHQRNYRAQCLDVEGHCQEEVINAAARALARSIEYCGDDVNQALIRYNSGRCTMRGNRYSSRVQQVYRNMISQL